MIDWPAVLDCDPTSSLEAIQRAARRRADELMAGPLRGEHLGARLRQVWEAEKRASRDAQWRADVITRLGRIEEIERKRCTDPACSHYDVGDPAESAELSTDAFPGMELGEQIEEDLRLLEDGVRKVASIIGPAFDEMGAVFALVGFSGPGSRGNWTTYASNGVREDMVRALRELADKLERDELMPPVGNGEPRSA